MPKAIEAVESLLRSGPVTPARHRVDFPHNSELVFAVGGNSYVSGVRSYFSRLGKHYDDQVVCVWHAKTGALRGVVIGYELGVLRMGAIGGVAMKRFAPKEVRTAAIIGSGRQAAAHLDALRSVRDVGNVRVYSRNADNVAAFCARHDAIASPGPQAAVEGADVVILATNSLRPVVEADWVKGASYIHTVGYKSPKARELPLEIADGSSLVTDSLPQVAAFGPAFILHGTPHMERLKALDADVSGRCVCYPMGVTGADVVVAAGLLDG